MKKTKKNENILQARLSREGKRRIRWLARQAKLPMTTVLETMITVAYDAAKRA